MTFSSTASLISTDLDNTLRGLYRDNADHSITGSTAETDAGSTTVTGGTIGPTGYLHIVAAGNSSGAGGTKQVKVYIGATAIATISVASGSRTWVVDCKIWNTSSAAQRIINVAYDSDTLVAGGYTTSAVDTSSNQTVKTTIKLASSGDTITAKIFDLFVCQIQ